MLLKQKCFNCTNKSVWQYVPGKPSPSNYYCDLHVPRGCSCNLLEDGSENLDELGRSYPCCEYDYDPDGFILE
jgi:hypothetical protein